MGHDISGYRPSDKQTEVAYLRRSAFNELNDTIYNALDCHDFNGGVSGNGKSKEFTTDELTKALSFIGEKEELTPERNFLTDCLKNTEDNKILISFY